MGLVGRCVSIVQWNSWLVFDSEGSLELHTEVGVLGAAVACIPAKVNIELQQVGQPSDILGACRLTTRQGSESIEIDRFFPLSNQVSIQESRMAQFVVSIVGDVLRHITVKVAECGDVGRIPALDSSQFVVLLPQISLDEFGCRGEL